MFEKEKSEYFELLVQLNQQLKEDIVSVSDVATSRFECSGIEEFSFDEAEVDNLLGTEACSGESPSLEVIGKVERYASHKSSPVYKYYFCGKNAAKNVENFINYLKTSYGKLSYNLSVKEDEDWGEVWRDEHRPIVISERIIVVPSWLAEAKSEFTYPYKVIIEPGMGFGTGQHETTYLCLKHFDMLLDRDFKLGKVLDFGCGSGILGITANKVGASLVHFYDIDEQALKNCKHNIELNWPTSSVENLHIYSKNSRDNLKGSYNLIFANILLNVLKEEREFFISSLAPGAHLILSGILSGQVSELKEAFRDLELVSELTRGDWSSVLLRKR